MEDWINLGTNIIKLEGYGLYITYIDNEYFESNIIPNSGHPVLDPDGCISWSRMEDPPNQRFLNILNARYNTSVTMNDFDSRMSISEVKAFVKAQKEQKKVANGNASLRWLVKNIKERDK